MYQEEYKRWMEADLEDPDLKPELTKIEGNDEEIKERFAVALKFGTAGLRGVLGAGTNRMNIYVVRQATQGLANWVKTQGGSQTVAISETTRCNERHTKDLSRFTQKNKVRDIVLANVTSAFESVYAEEIYTELDGGLSVSDCRALV